MAVLNASVKVICSLVMTLNSAVIGAKRETSPQIDSAVREQDGVHLLITEKLSLLAR